VTFALPLPFLGFDSSEESWLILISPFSGTPSVRNLRFLPFGLFHQQGLQLMGENILTAAKLADAKLERESRSEEIMANR
jgi:hypothetical protein